MQSILLQSVTEPEAATTAAIAAQNDLSDLLQYYQCPYEADPELLCSFYARFDGMCPFGHRLTAITTTGIEPTELPSYICVLYLLCRCHGDATVGAASGLTRCKDGLHLTTAELMDGRRVQEMLAVEVLDADSKLEQREQEVQQIINRLVEAREEGEAEVITVEETVETAETPETPDTSENLDPNADDQPDGAVLPPPEEPDCCSICYTEFTTVEAFGLLERCDHAFCASCILAWFQNRTDLRERICPYCRAESNRLVVWPVPNIDSNERKATVFELQYRCFRLVGRQDDDDDDSSDSSEDDHEEEEEGEGNDNILLFFGNENNNEGNEDAIAEEAGEGANGANPNGN